jgi:hypothetical protein
VSSTVYVRAQCARDLTAADCARCLQDSAQAMDWDLDAARGDGGAAAAVVGFNCHVRFEVSTALAPRSDQSDDPSDHSSREFSILNGLQSFFPFPFIQKRMALMHNKFWVPQFSV